MIRKIEEISMNSWPSLKTLLYDGWIIRFSHGYTKRANSVNPIYNSSVDTYEKIKYCESLFRKRNLETTFKITDNVYPENLDEILEKYGYKIHRVTSVQLLNLDTFDFKSNNDIELNEDINDKWIDYFIELKDLKNTYKSTMKCMLSKIRTQKCFASLYHKEDIIACGLGVIQQNMVGLFDIHVHEDFRRRGLGTQISGNIIKWAKNKKAEYAYLQVMTDNGKALSLYRKLGFKEIYQYWYRIKR